MADPLWSAAIHTTTGARFSNVGVEDVVAQTSVETAHLDRPTANRGCCQIARHSTVWRIGFRY
jgi:hypothetical protein